MKISRTCYVDDDEPLLSSTDQNKDEAASDTEGVDLKYRNLRSNSKALTLWLP